MSESRIIRDPFLNKDVEISSRLVDRLRGKYASGPTMPNGEPEFGWHEFETPPIQHEAADEIEGLRAVLQQVYEFMDLDNKTGDSALWTDEYSDLFDDIAAALVSKERGPVE